ncbi:MAG: RHS repeat-associated core domain-containing protein, partial [Acidobacteriaceae bacterium]
ELSSPWGVAFDAAGNLYIADAGNNVIREVSASTGVITTIAGNGIEGFAGDGGPATSAEFGDPVAMVFDAAGNLYISDQYNSRIRKVTISTGIITTIAGGGTAGYIGDGGPATNANIGWTEGITFDSAGNLYIGDKNNNRVRKVAASTGIITTIAGNGVLGYSGDGGPATSAELQYPGGVALDAHGNVYVSDFGNNRIREVNFKAVVEWSSPAAITYGMALSGTQLNATANVPGTFTYTPATGAVPTAGTDTLSVLFTPTDTTDYTTATASVALTVDQAAPTLAWPTPAAIDYGTALSSTQLDATASVPGNPNLQGSLVYTPASGTVLPAGDQALSVVFTPTDSTDYKVVTETVFLTVNNANGGTSSQIYSYTIPPPAPSQGYAPNGNLLSYTDSVMGAWTFNYDNLNRLISGAVTPAVSQDSYYCWSYDNFGNRWQQMGSNQPITGGGNEAVTPCQSQSGSSVNYAWANYSTSGNNQMTTTVQAPGGVQYDAAGDVINDGANQYLYNADGKICAVEQTYQGITVMTGYIYDADGQRVAKGTIASMSCDPSVNGFTANANYVRDQSGNQLSQFDGSGNWVHTNIYANGALIATDDTTETHFYLNDWMGTRRVQTNYAGAVEQNCSSLPYGDAETCGPTPTENLYTGKERDSESGNDYFGARYYASTMGRFLSPDWSAKEEPVPYAKMDDPQTLNLYSYMRNNPLGGTDPDGHSPLWWQRFWNGLLGYGSVTDAQLAATEQYQRQWLIAHAGDDATKEHYKNASGKEVFEAYVCTQSSSCMQNAVASGQVNITPPPSGLGSNVQKTLDSIDQTGKNLPNQAGGQTFQNREGLLPDKDANGNPITYQKWDTEASKQLGQARTGQRLVTGSDGSAYLTDSHYSSFTKIR